MQAIDNFPHMQTMFIRQLNFPGLIVYGVSSTAIFKHLLVGEDDGAGSVLRSFRIRSARQRQKQLS